MNGQLGYVYVMRIGETWMVRLAGRLEAFTYLELAKATAAAEGFCSAEAGCRGWQVAIWVRRPEEL